MCVVDDDGERLPLVHGLETPGHSAHRLDSLGDRIVRQVEQARHRDRRQGVLDVESTEQVAPDRNPGRREGRSVVTEVEPFGANICFGAEAERDDTLVAELA